MEQENPPTSDEVAALLSDLSQLVDGWTRAGLRDLPPGALSMGPSIESPARPPEPERPRTQAPPMEPVQRGPLPGTAASRPPAPPATEPRFAPGPPLAQPLRSETAAQGTARPAEPRDTPPAPEPAVPVPEVGSTGSLWAALAQRPSTDQELARIRERMGDCRRCPLASGRTRLVFGTGSPTAEVVIVGEAPGREEDLQGEPFVGAAGQMLDRMIENVLGRKRSDVYILNVVKCRPPENRDPEPAEITACRGFLDSQVLAIRPKVILALGRFAAQVLLDTPRGIKALRGRWGAYRGIPVMPTFHPAYLLRTPEDKRLTLEDLIALKQRLDAQAR